MLLWRYNVRGSAVHPHARGDSRGLSPWREDRAYRFTPTCVGTTVARSLVPDSASVHPHVRGEDQLPVPTVRADAGSPPRAWGRLLATLSACPQLGSPPRAWGRPHRAMSHRVYGSPPRAWGILTASRLRMTPGRFTPTCVGKTSATCEPCRAPVHPHVRGEDAAASPGFEARPVHPHVRGDDAVMRAG